MSRGDLCPGFLFLLFVGRHSSVEHGVDFRLQDRRLVKDSRALNSRNVDISKMIWLSAEFLEGIPNICE